MSPYTDSQVWYTPPQVLHLHRESSKCLVAEHLLHLQPCQLCRPQKHRHPMRLPPALREESATDWKITSTLRLFQPVFENPETSTLALQYGTDCEKIVVQHRHVVHENP
jgi:hypothetical protein